MSSTLISAASPVRSESAAGEAASRRFFVAVLALAVIYLWALPIRSSFWLDETATYWIIKDGVAHLWTRSFDWAGQSPLYYLTVWSALMIGGRQEWVLRLPSLLAMLGAAYWFYRLAARLFDSATARWAVLCFACAEPVAFAAADARPYALGLWMLLASAYMLVRWLEEDRRRHAVGYVLFSALALYTHYLFAPALAVLGLYAMSRTWRHSRAWPRKLLAAWIAVALLMLPLLAQFSRFYQSRAGHSFAETPTFSDLLASLAPPVLICSLAAGLLLAGLVSRSLRTDFAAPSGSVLLAIAWAAAPPLVLFAISVCTPAKLFVPRYFISAVPGLCLLAAWLIRSCAAASGQRLVAASVFVTAVLSFGTLRHAGEDWLGAARSIRAETRRADLPVLVASGFVEGSDPRALDDPQWKEVLFAPEQIYPTGGRLIRLPYRLDETSAQYLERLLPSLEREQRFVLLVRFQGVTFESWLSGRLAPYGFRAESLGNFGRVGVFLFRRT